MVGVVDVVLVDVVVVVVVVGALLFAPRLYMFRIPDCPGATDAIPEPADEDPPELVIQGWTINRITEIFVIFYHGSYNFFTRVIFQVRTPLL